MIQCACVCVCVCVRVLPLPSQMSLVRTTLPCLLQSALCVLSCQQSKHDMSAWPLLLGKLRLPSMTPRTPFLCMAPQSSSRPKALSSGHQACVSISASKKVGARYLYSPRNICLFHVQHPKYCPKSSGGGVLVWEFGDFPTLRPWAAQSLRSRSECLVGVLDTVQQTRLDPVIVCAT